MTLGIKVLLAGKQTLVGPHTIVPAVRHTGSDLWDRIHHYRAATMPTDFGDFVQTRASTWSDCWHYLWSTRHDAFGQAIPYAVEVQQGKAAERICLGRPRAAVRGSQFAHANISGIGYRRGIAQRSERGGRPDRHRTGPGSLGVTREPARDDELPRRSSRRRDI